jgi:hypothetical protein
LETEHFITENGSEIHEEKSSINHPGSITYGPEIQEIVSYRPSFWVRWGMVVFFFLILLITAISFFIEYPDVVTARGTLIAVNAPKQIVIKNDGRLVKLAVQEKQIVKAEDVLGFMESTAMHEDVLKFAMELDSISLLVSAGRTNEIVLFLSKSYDHLGELQSDYQMFSASFHHFLNYLNNGFYLKKRKMLQQDIIYLHRLHAEFLSQKSLVVKDVELSDSTFGAHEMLKNDGVISSVDYRNEKSKLIAKKLTLPQISSSIISNESQLHDKEKEISALENEIDQQKSIFLQSLYTMKSKIEEWKKKYLLIAPIDGIVNFTTFLQENQELKKGDVVCYINPGNSSYYIETWLPQRNFGKVAIGQEALIEFHAYPYREFGKVEAIVDFISTLPGDSGYLARLLLPNGLITTYRRTLTYQNGLTLQAQVITKKRNLFQRFVGGVSL